MKATEINLEEYRTRGSKVFTGRERGKKIRIDSQIDSLIEKDLDINIVIPEDIMSINPSFLEEFLKNVIIKLGKEKFIKRVHFTSTSSRYNIIEDLEEAIDRVLRNNNALSKYK